MGKTIGVLGAGGWGITLSILLEGTGNKVVLWEPLKESCKLLAQQRENTVYFPGFKIPASVSITSSVKEAAETSELLIVVVRSVFLRTAVKRLKPYYKNQPILIATKGIEIKTGKRMSEVLADELGGKSVFGVLSGPTIAKEIASGKPSAAVIGIKNKQLANTLQEIFSSNNLRVYTNKDIIGIEIGGAFKNVLAVGAGIIDGLDLGINTKASYLTRGLNEMIKIGLSLGAKEKTFRGLSGIGDLITTSFSEHSRNRMFGEAIIKTGKNIYLKQTKSVIEGIPAAKAFYSLKNRIGIDMPITNAIYKIVHMDKDPAGEIKQLMNRELKAE